MIKSRMIAAAAAVLLAILGTVMLLSYAHKTTATAAPTPETVNVMVATGSIPVGLPASGLPKMVKSTPVPVAAVLPGRVTDLSQLAGKVALVPITPGEQLLDSKFGEPPAVTSSSTAVKIPPGSQQLTILLRPEQVLAGHLAPGDTVGVFISLGGKDAKVGRTHLVAHKVLVTRVEPQITHLPPSSVPSNGTAEATPTATTTSGPTTGTSAPAATANPSVGPDPTSSVLVTLATTSHVAEKIVFGAEYGSIWLSNEPLTADESGTEIVDGLKVYNK